MRIRQVHCLQWRTSRKFANNNQCPFGLLEPQLEPRTLQFPIVLLRLMQSECDHRTEIDCCGQRGFPGAYGNV